MDSDTRELMRKGIAARKRGDRAVAHQFFLQVVQNDPEDPVGLVFAGVTAPDDKQSEKYLRAAKKIAPEHPAVRHGWNWLQTHRKTKPVKETPSRWIARELQKKKPQKPGFWLIGAGTLVTALGIITFFLMLVLGTFYYLNVIRPAAGTALLSPTETAAAALLSSHNPTASPTPSASITPTLTPTTTPTLTATQTRTATATPVASATTTYTSLEATDLAYPPVSYTSFYSDPQHYAGESLRLTGTVIGFGEAYLQGDLVFSLLLGPTSEDETDEDLILSPVLVLGIAPDTAFDLDVIVTVYGLGADEMQSLTVQGVDWSGPVLLGEGLFEIQ